MVEDKPLSNILTHQLQEIVGYYLRHYNTQDRKELNISLMEGDLGIVLFLGYYYLLENDREVYDLCIQLLQESIEQASSKPTSWTFCSGLAGLGWLIQHFAEIGLIEIDDTILNEYDRFLGRMGVQSLKEEVFDFLHGSIGAGIYLISRKPNEERVALIHGIVDQLIMARFQDELGMRWINLFKDDPAQRESCDLGLAHGLPSIIMFLLNVYKWGLRMEECKEMIEGIVKFLKGSRLSPECISVFPYRIRGFKKIPPTSPNEPSRLAWCYGDLGIAFSLFHAGGVLNDKNLINYSSGIMNKAARRRSVQETFISDGGLCHGYWGVGYMFSRMYDHSKEKAFHEAAKHWYGQGLELIDAQEGVGNFKEYFVDKWIDSKSFLTGLAGVGLAMISEVSNGQFVKWEEALLLNINQIN